MDPLSYWIVLLLHQVGLYWQFSWLKNQQTCDDDGGGGDDGDGDVVAADLLVGYQVWEVLRVRVA